MADKRAYAKFDIGYLDNPKVLPILDANPNAVLMHIASVLYCAQHLTDGVITMRAMQRRVGADPEDAQQLVNAGLWHLPGHDCESCPQPPEGMAQVHDYLEHNRTAAGVKKASEAGKKGAAGRWNDDANRNADRNAKPMRTPMARERERKKEDIPSPPPEEFTIFWENYPKKIAKKSALKAWVKASQTADPQDIINGAKRYAELVTQEKTEKQFIKSPDGWLNAGRWDDELPTPTKPKHNPLWD